MYADRPTLGKQENSGFHNRGRKKLNPYLGKFICIITHTTVCRQEHWYQRLSTAMHDKKIPTLIFGEVLQELRLQQGLTQDQLAERANTERSHISALERAEKGPSLATIFNLSDALGISAGELIGQVEKKLRARRK